MDKDITKLTKEAFNKVFIFLQMPDFLPLDYLYEVYEIAFEGIEELSQNEIFSSIQNINSFELIQYLVGEYIYSVANRNQEEIKQFHDNDEIKTSMASVVADKYLSLSTYHAEQKTMINKYIPPISSLSTYLNFMLSILPQYKKNDPTTTLIADLLSKSISIAKCTLNLLTEGFETEAFSSWRTLHECECVLVILEKYGEPIIVKYNKHLQFSVVFKDIMEDKEKQTEIFNSMKEEMKEYNLKSKDIKKYIEYGWLYGVPNVKEDETFKLNFRDGLEKVAGLQAYASRYEMSSEIIHSTPMLIYSNKEYFYFVTLLSLYESFFRLEKVFTSLFAKHVNEAQMNNYINMRKVYYAQLVNIHKREMNNFKAWQEKTRKKN